MRATRPLSARRNASSASASARRDSIVGLTACAHPSYDDGAAEKLRTFCLTFHDVRAVVVELAYRADQLRRAESLAPVRRTALALETMQLYAPMAHALDAGPLCAELEDLSLQWLFPSSYKSLEQWLRGEGPADRSALDRAREWLTEALCADPGLMTLVGGPAGVAVKARRKSLFSTMRKVLRDGRAREDVHDLPDLGRLAGAIFRAEPK